MARLPSDPSRLTGHRKVAPFKLINNKPAPQPKLPVIKGHSWPQQTREWWAMWGRSPLTADFTANDWSELLDSAPLHALVWDPKTPPSVRMRAAAELRNRVAKFGATPLDRQRLRITFAMADIEEDKAEARKERQSTKGARQRRGPHLEAVPEDA